MNKKVIFGITGLLASGKSTLAQYLKNYWPENTLNIIEVDDIRRFALWDSTQLHHVQLRKDLATKFSLNTDTQYHWLNRTSFTDLIFANKDNLSIYSKIATPVFIYDIKILIQQKNGFFAIIWTKLLEENYTNLLNSPLVLLSISENERQARLETMQDHLKPRLLLETLPNDLLDQASHFPHILLNEENLPHDFQTNNVLANHIYSKTISQCETDMVNDTPKMDKNYSFCKFRIPENGGRVIWEITNECNYGCTYCIFASTGRKPIGELSTEEIFSSLEDLKQHGFSYIKFTGGEPFLRPDMIDILAYAKKLNFFCDISTNASKLTPLIAQQLSDLKLEFIHVSLDGHTQAIHEAVRGKKSFYPTINGIELLIKHKRSIRIGCVIHKHNENFLFDMASYCSLIGAKELVFSLMEPVGRLKGKNSSLATKTTKELITILNNIKLSYPQIQISHNLESLNIVNIEHINNSIDNKKSPIEKTSCPAGKKFLFLNSLGVVSPCTWISEHLPQYIGGKIHEDGLTAIFQTPPLQNMYKLSEQLKTLEHSICPVSDLEKTNKIQTVLAASNLINYKNKFSSTAPIYRFSTENLTYLKNLPVFGKHVLTIGGSYDHAIDLALLGANKIENIDLNISAKYYAELKRLALIHFNFETFKNFFGNSPLSFNHELYLQLKPFLSFDTVMFWDLIYSKYKNNLDIINSAFFHNRNNQDFLSHSLYLSNENFFMIAKQNIVKSDFIWHSQNINEHHKLGNFDLILLSNIADYSHKIFPGDNHTIDYKNNIVMPWLSHLKDYGTLMFAYVFDIENLLWSDIRNKFNLKSVRQELYNNIPDYTFKELSFKSSMKDTLNDSVCLLTKN